MVRRGFQMKKYITTFLLLFIPFVSMAEDHCTNPKEFTVDKRCYVTNAQKQKKPYNAVVALIDGNHVYCTGTIRDYKGKLYVYTAKHCVNDKSGNIKDTIEIQTQDGKRFTVNKNKVGDYVPQSLALDRSGDWAIYNIPDEHKNLSSTTFSNNSKNSGNTYDARVVGYGALKIMSNADILYFKSKYVTWLKDKKGIKSDGTETAYGWQDGGINTKNAYANNFVDYLRSTEKSYYKGIFQTASILKQSFCSFTGAGVQKGCQLWGGNSGGGVFDNQGNLMGILTGYLTVIGGESHAASGNSINVNFLRKE